MNEINFSLILLLLPYTIANMFNFTINKNNNLYSTISYNENNNEFNLIKNGSNYSINDAIFIEFSSKIEKPKQLSFSYKIPNKDNINTSSFEGCDIRLTSITYEKLKAKEYKTEESDIAFFRVKYDKKVNLNSLPIYVPYNYSNFGISEKIDYWMNIDIYFNWDTKKANLLMNGTGKWNIISGTKKDAKDVQRTTDFYHENIPDNANINKVILYNFSPNSSCLIRNLSLCSNFCSKESNQLYNEYVDGFYLYIQVLLLILIYSLLIL